MSFSRILSAFFISIFISTQGFAQSPIQRPKLVVGIVVDQMRNEYIHRFYQDFGNDGFRRLIDDGFYYSNVHYNYFPTYTAPGHASIYTGTTPSVHGIVGNYWFHRGENQAIYCTADDSSPVVGGEGKGMSARRLKTTTITDELKLTTNMRGKVIGISIKDRGAILPAGHFGDGAYWFSDDAEFVSSTYFMDSVPDYVQAFNDRKVAADYIRKGWQKSAGVTFDESQPDDTPYESRLGNKATPTFPYDLGEFLKKGGLSSIKTTPFGNDIVVDFTEEVVVNENLGRDEWTDFLAVSFSSTDYVGHAMGPRAIETQDTYIRLDKTIARLLAFLDAKVGEGNYLVFLTADHGANEVPSFLNDENFIAEAVDEKSIREEIKALTMEKYGENVLISFDNNNVHLNPDVMRNLKLDEEEVLQTLSDYFMEKSYIKRVYTEEDILEGNPADPFAAMFFNGYDRKQNGQLIVLPESGTMFYKKTGTTHGSTFTYDTHVPLLFYGWNIPSGRSSKKYSITNIAPTLSQKINISLPSGTPAEILPEILD